MRTCCLLYARHLPYHPAKAAHKPWELKSVQTAVPGRPAVSSVILALGLGVVVAANPPAAAQELEVIGSTRTTHLTTSLKVRPTPRQSRLSEVRVRSGSLALHLEAVEIVFADGGVARTVVQNSLAPGRQSRPIRVDHDRPIQEILVMKRPGMRPGETTIQVLGRVVQNP